MWTTARRRIASASVIAALATVGVAAAETAEAEPRAREIAESVLEAMGGRQAWQDTRYVRWNFFGRRMHHWDRWTGDVRIETPEVTVLMNIHDKKGRAWRGGEEVVDEAERAELLDSGHQWWVNDSYWMFMPYKLLDPGVRLAYAGVRDLPDGRPADVLSLTFADGTGYTPRNRYEVYVAKDTGRVELWRFFADAGDDEARFDSPWEGWQRFGRILLATGHGRGEDWQIAVFDRLPTSFFDDPAPPAMTK